jgi:NHLM bacteriocin system ABC transporter peptidase/ATP-binding protein
VNVFRRRGAGEKAAPPRPVSTPTILQMEAVECGAASLAMILAYHGRWVSLEELRTACGVSRDGVKASNLLKAARGYGMVSKGFRKELDRLAAMPMPVVLFWGFGHFVVLDGFKGEKAIINDPSGGRREIEPEQFEAAFTGVVLAVALLWARLQGSRAALTHVLLATFALVIPGLALPVFARVFVDDILIGRQVDWLAPFAVAMALVILLRAALTWVQQSVLLRLEAKLSVVPATELLWRFLALPMSFFAQRHPGELVSRMEANDRIARQLSGELATSAVNSLTLVFYAAVMLSFDWLLGLIVIGLSAGNVWLVRWGAKQQAPKMRLAQSRLGGLLAATVGPIQAIETLKASNMEGQAHLRWAGRQAALLNLRRELGSQSTVLGIVPPLLQALARTLVLGLGAWRVMQGDLTLGTLIALLALAESYAQPLSELVEQGSTFQAVRADLGRVEDVMRAAPDHEAAPGEPLLSADLEVEGLAFGYNPLEPPLLEAISFSIRPGARVALVGASGSGKSTAGRLIAGLAKPWAGEIRLAGRPVNELALSDRAGVVAYVDQEIFLFEGTVRENLTLWDDTANDAQLMAALSDASLLDEVSERPGGLDAVVAEGGFNFSGGQRQRLEIARALVDNPELLILDEATAALDPATEKVIDDNLRRRGCACLIIAHRLSTIRDADEIIVLDKGRIRERGDHASLIKAGGEYAALVALQ